MLGCGQRRGLDDGSTGEVVIQEGLAVGLEDALCGHCVKIPGEWTIFFVVSILLRCLSKCASLAVSSCSTWRKVLCVPPSFQRRKEQLK